MGGSNGSIQHAPLCSFENPRAARPVRSTSCPALYVALACFLPIRLALHARPLALHRCCAHQEAACVPRWCRCSIQVAHAAMEDLSRRTETISLTLCPREA